MAAFLRTLRAPVKTWKSAHCPPGVAGGARLQILFAAGTVIAGGCRRVGAAADHTKAERNRLFVLARAHYQTTKLVGIVLE